MNNYIVQKGDTLYGIAKRFNTSVQSIKELNNLKTFQYARSATEAASHAVSARSQPFTNRGRIRG